MNVLLLNIENIMHSSLALPTSSFIRRIREPILDADISNFENDLASIKYSYDTFNFLNSVFPKHF